MNTIIMVNTGDCVTSSSQRLVYCYSSVAKTCSDTFVTYFSPAMKQQAVPSFLRQPVCLSTGCSARMYHPDAEGN